jgi:hypothetical protein
MAVFYSSTLECLPELSCRFVLNDRDKLTVAPVIIGTTLVFTFHMPCNSVNRSLNFNTFSAPFFTAFLSVAIETSICETFFPIADILHYYYYLSLLLLLLLSSGLLPVNLIFLLSSELDVLFPNTNICRFRLY